MPRTQRDNLTNWQTHVTFVYANRVNSIYGQSGETTIYTHTRNKKDLMNMLNYVVERDMLPYTELDYKQINFGEHIFVGSPTRRKNAP